LLYVSKQNFKIYTSEYLRSKRVISRLDNQNIFCNFRTPSQLQGAFVLTVQATKPATR